MLGYVVVVNNGNGFQLSGNVALIKFSICNITEQTSCLTSFYSYVHGALHFLYAVLSKIVLMEIEINYPRRCLFHMQILVITHGCEGEHLGSMYYLIQTFIWTQSSNILVNSNLQLLIS